ncbi:hypothetical protein [Burkholderia sp. 22PA0106]|uniref:hypothetical protein n=1 Tax=Burkholderia sp. 22PA0106 TaxID=3237371 RepID=UPI0039C39FCA
MNMVSESSAYLALGKIYFLRTMAGLSTDPTLAKQLLFSVRTDKLHFIESDAGVPLGYIAWASINRDTLRQLRATAAMPYYLHEWMEGSLSLVIDILVLPEWRASATRLLLRARRGHRSVVTHRPRFGTRRYARRDGSTGSRGDAR